MKRIILILMMVIAVTIGTKHSLARTAIKIDNETVYKEAFNCPIKELKEASYRWFEKQTNGLLN